MARDSFVMYKSWAEMMAGMPDKELAELTRAIACYQTGRDVAIDSPMVAAVFNMVRDQFEKDTEKYEETCRKRTESISKRWNTNESNSLQKNTKEYKSIQNGSESESDSDSESDIKEKDTPKGVSKEKARPRADVPTLEEVKAYCMERHSSVVPEHFVDYYKSQSWKKANGRPLTDWKAAVRTWEQKDREKARSGTTNKFNAFEQRKNDMDDIESKMFNRRLAK